MSWLKTLFFNNWFAVNPGPDVRFNPLGLLGLTQRALSVRSNELPVWDEKEEKPFTYWDEVRNYVAKGKYSKPRFYYVKQTVHRDGQLGDWNGHDERRGVVSIFRIGWRLDPNAKPPTYIPGITWKRETEDRPMEKGY
jgi:hypothetical protein